MNGLRRLVHGLQHFFYIAHVVDSLEESAYVRDGLLRERVVTRQR